MSDKELRAAYQEQVRLRAPADRRACPEPELLEALAQGPTTGNVPNIALLEHVLACAFCRPEFELLRAISAAAANADAEQPVTHSAHGAARGWRRFNVTQLAVAAALLLTVVVGEETWRRARQDNKDLQTRGTLTDSSDVQVVSPATSVAASALGQFVWKRVAGANNYSVELLDTTGVLLLTRITADTALELTSAELDKVKTLSAFDWQVAARRGDSNERRSAIVRVRVTSQPAR